MKSFKEIENNVQRVDQLHLAKAELQFTRQEEDAVKYQGVEQEESHNTEFNPEMEEY